jgi:parallel beta-helix repeat protein
MGIKLRTVSLACLAALGMAPAFGSSISAAPCNATFVVQLGRMITVLPTGLDDTENLQCAFNSAATVAPGTTVRLDEGTYYTRQIVVNDFEGTFIGAGADRSVLTNLPNLHVTPVNMYFNPPSADNPWPTLVAFVGGNFLVSDLGIRITGARPTTGWSIFGIPTLYEMAHGIVVLGIRANAFFSRVTIEGEPAQNTLLGYNLINGIFFEGFIGEVSPPISGSYVVHDSTFRHLGSGTPIYNVSDASILVSRNNSKDVFLGMDGGGLLDSTYDFSSNTVEGSYGIDLYDVAATVQQITSSKMLIRNNVFSGQYGVYLDSTFAGGTECLVEANNFQNVTNIGIYLGPGTSYCTVAGNTQTTIVDLGTDNKIVGGRTSGANVLPPSNPGLQRWPHR